MRGAGAAINLNDAGGFDFNLDQVDLAMRQLLVDEIGEDEDAVLEALKVEAAGASATNSPRTENPNNADAEPPPEPGDLGAAAESTDYYRTIAGALMQSPDGRPNGGSR